MTNQDIPEAPLDASNTVKGASDAQTVDTKSPGQLRTPLYEATEITGAQLFFGRPEVVDFWATLFPRSGHEADAFEFFMAGAMDESGYHVEQTSTSFAQNVFFAKTRKMWWIRVNNILTTTSVEHLRGKTPDLYVSIRVMFFGRIDQIKAFLVFGFLFLVGLLTGSFWQGVAQAVAITLGSRVSTSFYSIGTGSDAILFGLIAGVIYSAFLCGWWYWLYGDAFARVREDMNEMDRDDAAALGMEIYRIITETANELALKAVPSLEENVPRFGTNTVTNRTANQRRQRI